MAEAFFNQMAQGKAMAISAGTRPATKVNPTVIKAMREAGMDIGNQESKLLTFEMVEDVDRVITMGCSVEEVCPASLVPAEDWELAGPEGKSIEEVRQIRDQIKARVETLLKELE